MTLTLTVCPDTDCAVPAEEVDRFVLDSTDGPIVHVATHCANGHHYIHIEETR